MLIICTRSVRTMSSVDRHSEKRVKVKVPVQTRHHLARTTPIPRNGPLLVSPDKRAATAKNSRHGEFDDNGHSDDDDSFEQEVAAWREAPTGSREKAAAQRQGDVLHLVVTLRRNFSQLI
jgi:hypothetical protein